MAMFFHVQNMFYNIKQTDFSIFILCFRELSANLQRKKTIMVILLLSTQIKLL